jgi:hypothetical protein
LIRVFDGSGNDDNPRDAEQRNTVVLYQAGTAVWQLREGLANPREVGKMDVKEVPPFPNPGVRLIKEDDRIAIFEEIFEPGKPTPPHRHTRDYIAFFPKAGKLKLVPVAGEPEEEVTIAAGAMKDGAFTDGTVLYGRVPRDGTAHFAVNESSEPILMIAIEIKGTGSEKAAKQSP